MVKVYYDTDCNIDLLEGKIAAITGYGNRGHAHALNLKDSGVNVVVGLRSGSKSRVRVEEAGLTVLDTAEAAKADDVIMILTLDQDQPSIYKEDIESNLEEGNMLMLAHGFSIHFNQIVVSADVDTTIRASRSPGHTVRSQYQEDRGVPSLIAVHQDADGKAHDYALACAGGIGTGRARTIEITLREEMEINLFGEQAVLCGGICELMQAGFDTLVEVGYEPEMAYFERIHEMKLIANLINNGGFVMACCSIFDTAEYGDYVTGKRLITGETCKKVKKVLVETQDGTFAENWITENRAARRSHFLATRRVHAVHPSEKTDEKLRKTVSRLKK